MAAEPSGQPDVGNRRFAIAVSALFLLAPVAFLMYALSRRGGTSVHREALLIVPGIVFFALLIAALVFRVNRRLRRLVGALPDAKARDGQLCPYCFRTPTAVADLTPCCKKAPRSWTREQYRAWWNLVENGEIHPARAGDMPHDEALPSAWETWRPGLMTCVLFATALLFEALRSGATDVVSWIILLLPRTLVGYGIDLAGRGVGGWIGTERVCAACSYPLIGNALSERCPECGSAWLALGASRRNRGPSRPRFLVVGGAIALTSFVLMWQWGWGGPTWIRRIQPTSGLILAATASGSNSLLLRLEAWNELVRRTLSPQEKARLFDRILDLRTTQSFLPVTLDAWVQADLASGQATPAQVSRWRRESFEPRVDAPATARVGEAISVEIHGEHLAPLLPPANGVVVHLVGAWFDGDSPALATTTAGAWTLEVSQEKTVPSITVRADRAGQRDIVIRLWLVARGYGTMKQPMNWNADGTPILPPDVLWAEPIELRRSVVITP